MKLWLDNHTYMTADTNISFETLEGEQVTMKLSEFIAKKPAWKDIAGEIHHGFERMEGVPIKSEDVGSIGFYVGGLNES